jgi:curved DNA-binding protein CbpA
VPPRVSIPSDDLYARLEVPVDASFEAIEIAWRALLKRHHPDVAGGHSLEIAKRINVAHDWLSDPYLRDRYDRDRLVRSKWGGSRASSAAAWHDEPEPATRAGAVRRARAAADPAAALRRFLDRVSALSRDELDRLSVADTTSIAFAASIHRFLTKAQAQAVTSLEREVRARLGPVEWAKSPVRDAVLAAGHELVLAAFLDEHLSEPYRGRARDRLLRGWEAAIDQPRYGPNTPAVSRFVARAQRLTADEVDRLVGATGRARLDRLPWPEGLDPEEDEGLRVSSVLAARDAAVAPALEELDRQVRQRAELALALTAHAFVLRHAFASDAWVSLLEPWRAATADPGTGRVGEERPEPRVTRR